MLGYANKIHDLTKSKKIKNLFTGDLAYMEAKLQFEKEVLLRDDYYNGIIQIRIGGNSVKHLK